MDVVNGVWFGAVRHVTSVNACRYPEEEGVFRDPLHWFEEVGINSGVAVATKQHTALGEAHRKS